MFIELIANVVLVRRIQLNNTASIFLIRKSYPPANTLIIGITNIIRDFVKYNCLKNLADSVFRTVMLVFEKCSHKTA